MYRKSTYDPVNFADRTVGLREEYFNWADHLRKQRSQYGESQRSRKNARGIRFRVRRLIKVRSSPEDSLQEDISFLAVLGNVEPLLFLIRRNAKTHGEIENRQKDQGADDCQSSRSQNTDKLID